MNYKGNIPVISAAMAAVVELQTYFFIEHSNSGSSFKYDPGEGGVIKFQTPLNVSLKNSLHWLKTT